MRHTGPVRCGLHGTTTDDDCPVRGCDDYHPIKVAPACHPDCDRWREPEFIQPDDN